MELKPHSRIKCGWYRCLSKTTANIYQ